MPAVSVIIPLHNKGAYVTETLSSLRMQVWEDWECLVVENHSTDNGPVLVEKAAQEDSRIRLVFAPERVRGPGAARNMGLDAANGEWILFLDSDDLIPPDYLESMLHRADEVPDAVIVAAPWREFEAGGIQDITEVKRPVGMETGGADIEDSAIAHTCWAVHAAVVRRNWLTVRRWPEELDGFLAEDTAFWFRAVHSAKVAYADILGALYRTQTENCRSDFSAEAWFEGNHRAALANLQFLSALGREPSFRQIETLVRHYESLYSRARAARNREVAERALDEANDWMRKLGSASGPERYSMRLRRLLGLPLFVRLRGFAGYFS